MTKIYTGSAINYGPSLPSTTTVADGSLFFKTGNVGGLAGLYLFGFSQDANSGLPGDQVGQSWNVASSIADYLLKAGGTMTGDLIIQSTGTYRGLRVVNPAGTSGGGLSSVDGVNAGVVLSSDLGPLSFIAGGIERLRLTAAGVLLLGGNTVWSSGNDGAGSGLDADVLDGLDSSYYLNSANHVGVIPTSRGGTGTTTLTQGGIVFGATTTAMNSTAAGTSGYLLSANGTSAPGWMNPSSITVGQATLATTATNVVIVGANDENAAKFVTFVDNAGSSMPLKVDSGIMYNPSTNVLTTTVTQAQNATNAANATNATNATNSVVIDESSVNATRYLTFVTAAGTGQLRVDGNLSYNPATNILSTTVTQAQNATLAASATLAAKASTLSAGGGNGTGMTFNWAGLGGQPQWVWGGNDGVNMNVYNPAAFNVASVQGYVPSVGYAGNTLMARDGGGWTGSINVSGNIVATGNITAYASDARLKKNIRPIEGALAKVASLGGYSYDWDMSKCVDVGFTPANEHEHGLLAQEVELVMPDAVAPAGFDSEYKTVRYERLVALLMAAVNEQQREIHALTKEVKTLKDKVQWNDFKKGF